MIYLCNDDPSSVGFCQCDVQELLRWVVLALPTMLLCFQSVLPVAPPNPLLDSFRVVRVIYMQGHARLAFERLQLHMIRLGGCLG